VASGKDYKLTFDEYGRIRSTVIGPETTFSYSGAFLSPRAHPSLSRRDRHRRQRRIKLLRLAQPGRLGPPDPVLQRIRQPGRLLRRLVRTRPCYDGLDDGPAIWTHYDFGHRKCAADGAEPGCGLVWSGRVGERGCLGSLWAGDGVADGLDGHAQHLRGL
jgi:hypothetical protein